MTSSKKVDDFIASAKYWPEEIARLRDIVRSTGLDEEFKWRGPCYTCQGKNVVGLGTFKSYFGLWFHQGALLDDTNRVLVNAQPGVTKALRQWRMTGNSEIKPAIIKRYVKEAAQLVYDGKTIASARNKRVTLPSELREALLKHKSVKFAFDKLGLTCQREYADYVAEAKRVETRLRRTEKVLPMIKCGEGLYDKYRK